ncbi:MAG: hypothetical protein A2Y75_04645 [Candidatus Solincola sediminis]|uniref:Ribosomal RNA small subunit methyltransferase E n=1 Tax=Candidatus Solincola sediminis TaxID=1797199 RepID=A0A1F2WGL5_9ACTN|nr:MAG: hypothetical protein A2Y75_04645 [Candidatus Solincola sediminis]
MTIPRLYIPTSRLKEGTINVEGHDHHYLSRVLRMHRDQEVMVLDGEGLVGSGRIREMSTSKTFIIVDSVERHPEEIPRIYLYQALISPGKMDRVVQDCAEAGASLVPFSSRRSRKSEDVAGERLNRWRKLAMEAWRLSGRTYMPRVGEPLGFDRLEESLGEFEMIVFADEDGGKRSAEVLGETQPGKVALLIGPEGGFCDEERTGLCSMGAKRVTLGKGIFRAETAGLVLILAARCHYGLL